MTLIGKRIAHTIIASMCAFTITTQSFANEKLLVVRGDGNYAPFEMLDSSGKLQGIHIEMVCAVAKRLDLDLTFKSLPWNRAVEFMAQGKADAITYIGKTPERETFAIFQEGNSLSETRNAFFTRSDLLAGIDYKGELESLASYRIGTIQGYSYGEQFDGADYLQKDSGARDQTALIKKLIGKRFELAIGNKGSIEHALHRTGLSQQVRALNPTFPGLKQYIAFSKLRKRHALAQKFAREMQTFKTSPDYHKILAKYGVSPE